MSLCSVDALFRGFDGIVVLNSGNGLQAVVLRVASRARVALNMDGVEWDRGKWGWLGREYFKFASRWGARFVHMPIVDSRAIGDVYTRLFGIRTTFIPYAVDLYDRPNADKILPLGLRSREYGLIVGRLIPENCVDVLMEGFQRVLPDKPLVVVGGANYESGFHRRLRALAGPNVRLLGHVHDQDLLWQLFAHSRIYLHGHSVGGTNPALLQALAAGCCIAANDVVFNREVMADAGSYFRPEAVSVAAAVAQLWDLASGEADALRARARGRVATGGYSWEQVVAAYEAALRWDDETPS